MEINNLKKEVTRLVKFNIVGIMNTSIDFIVFYILTTFVSFSVVPAQILAYSMGVINSYFMNRFWTFNVKGEHNKKQFLLFILVNLVALSLSTILIYLLAKVIEQVMIAKVMVTLIVMVINYLGQKYIIFNDRKEDE